MKNGTISVKSEVNWITIYNESYTKTIEPKSISSGQISMQQVWENCLKSILQLFCFIEMGPNRFESVS